MDQIIFEADCLNTILTIKDHSSIPQLSSKAIEEIKRYWNLWPLNFALEMKTFVPIILQTRLSLVIGMDLSPFTSSHPLAFVMVDF